MKIYYLKNRDQSDPLKILHMWAIGRTFAVKLFVGPKFYNIRLKI